MKKLLPWLASLLILVVGFGTIYAAVQQNQRSAANSPQIQMAEDAANGLDKGELAAVLVGPRVDMDKSLAPFTIIYNKKGEAVLGSGYLNGKVPKVDKDVLEAAKDKDYNAVTWEPKEGVRIAAVAVEAKDYYVLSGRNLREVEHNESETLQIVLLGLIVSVILLGAVFVLSGLNEEY